MIGKRKSIDFSTPSYKLDRIDNKELREKILSISYVEWKKLGFSKGTLHQLKGFCYTMGGFGMFKYICYMEGDLRNEWVRTMKYHDYEYKTRMGERNKCENFHSILKEQFFV